MTNITNIKNILERSLTQFLLALAFSTFLISVISCSDNSTEEKGALEVTKPSEESKKYPDGTYCADVTYFNPNTSTLRTYTLNVEVEDNALTMINWPNGGWLDDSHFSPAKLDHDGSCKFTSDKSYEYKIKITGPPCSNISIIEDERELTNVNNIPLYTLGSCASNYDLTEIELSEVERITGISRYDKISEEKCNGVYKYVKEIRSTSGPDGVPVSKLLYEGQMITTTTIGPDERILCQTIIAKRKGHYYLLINESSIKANLGIIKFNPELKESQEVLICPEPAKYGWSSYSMRVVNNSSDLELLKQLLNKYCTYSL
jgi:hypothetical protein